MAKTGCQKRKTHRNVQKEQNQTLWKEMLHSDDQTKRVSTCLKMIKCEENDSGEEDGKMIAMVSVAAFIALLALLHFFDH